MSWFTSTVQHETRGITAFKCDELGLDRPGPDPAAPRNGQVLLGEQVRSGPGMDDHAIADARARITGRRPYRSRIPAVPHGLPVALLLGDVLALVLQSVVVRASVLSAILFGVVVIISRIAVRQYRRRLALSVLDDLPRLIGSTIVAVGLTAVGLSVVQGGSSELVRLIQQAGWFMLFALVAQAVVTAAARWARARRPGRRTIIVGGGRMGSLLVEALLEHSDFGLEPVGVLDPGFDGAQPTHISNVLPVLETDIKRLADVVVEHEIGTAILALEDGGSHVDTVIALHQTGCETLLVPSLFEMHHDGPDVDRIRGVPLIRLRPDPTMRRSWWVKRGVDVLVAGLALLVLLPLLLVVAALVVLDSGRPVMFWQERVGLDGHIFRLCKFRSMRPESEAESQTRWNIASDPRVSRVGRLLRRTSIDEIPQFWNILCGQMSLVGPRPERPTFVERFTHEHERYWARHRVPVGLTGLAQVNGLRGDTSIRDRARYDNYYIANWSLWLDAKIILLTVREVLGGRGR